MYKPANAIALSDQPALIQIRLGIQGPYLSGKSVSAATFPNPIFLSTDRALGYLADRPDVLEVPIYDIKLCDSLASRTPGALTANKKDAILNWLRKEAIKLEHDQTLVIDNNTGVQAAFHQQYWTAPKYTKTGKVDDFAEWGDKIEYYNNIVDVLKSLKCNVVYICHETPDRNKEGELNGKVRPILSGQFGDQLGSHFTDWVRMHAYSKPTKYDKEFYPDFGLARDDFKAMVESFQGPTFYVWQMHADDLANCGTRTLVNAPKFIRADYQTFMKYATRISR